MEGNLPFLLCFPSVFLSKSFHVRRLQKRWVFFLYKSLYFECYAIFRAWATCDERFLTLNGVPLALVNLWWNFVDGRGGLSSSLVLGTASQPLLTFFFNSKRTRLFWGWKLCFFFFNLKQGMLRLLNINIKVFNFSLTYYCLYSVMICEFACIRRIVRFIKFTSFISL